MATTAAVTAPADDGYVRPLHIQRFICLPSAKHNEDTNKTTSVLFDLNVAMIKAMEVMCCFSLVNTSGSDDYSSNTVHHGADTVAATTTPSRKHTKYKL